MRGVLTLFGRGHRCRRRICSHLRRSRCGAASSGTGLGNAWPICTTHGARGCHGGGHRRPRPITEIRRTTGVGYRLGGRHRLRIRAPQHGPDHVADDAAAAIAFARAEQRIATLILPADVSWSDGLDRWTGCTPGCFDDPRPGRRRGIAELRRTDGDPHRRRRDSRARRRLPAGWRNGTAPGCSARPSRPGWNAARASRQWNASPTSVRPPPPNLEGTRHLIMAGAVSPVTFFGYPASPATWCPRAAQSTPWPVPSAPRRPWNNSPTGWHPTPLRRQHRCHGRRCRPVR